MSCVGWCYFVEHEVQILGVAPHEWFDGQWGIAERLILLTEHWRNGEEVGDPFFDVFNKRIVTSLKPVLSHPERYDWPRIANLRTVVTIIIIVLEPYKRAFNLVGLQRRTYRLGGKFHLRMIEGQETEHKRTVKARQVDSFIDRPRIIAVEVTFDEHVRFV